MTTRFSCTALCHSGSMPSEPCIAILDRGDTRVVKLQSLLFEYIKHVQGNRIENVTFKQKVARHGTAMAASSFYQCDRISMDTLCISQRDKKG